MVLAHARRMRRADSAYPAGPNLCRYHRMKRIRIIHETHYYYSQAVKFGPHRALLRPREGHDVHISRSKLKVEPAAEIRWLRDIYGNSIAVLSFEEASPRLSVASEVDVELYDDNPVEC